MPTTLNDYFDNEIAEVLNRDDRLSQDQLDLIFECPLDSVCGSAIATLCDASRIIRRSVADTLGANSDEYQAIMGSVTRTIAVIMLG